MITPKDYEVGVKNLINLFKNFNPDKSPKDASRLWFGGALGATVIHEELIPISRIGLITVCDKMEDGITMNNIKKTSGGCVQDYLNLPDEEIVYVLKSDPWWEKLHGACPLWDKFERGDYLNYDERLVLFSNLKYLKYKDTKISLYPDILQFYKPEVWQGHTFNESQLKSLMMSRALKPIPICYGENGKMTVAAFLREWKQQEEEKRVSVEELDIWMRENVSKVLSRPGLEYFNSQTGSGKTELIIQWLKGHCEGKKIIYAIPRYNLMDEFQKRCDINGLLVETLPPGNLTAKDKLLLQLGCPKDTRNPERADFIKRMLKEDTIGIFVITHALLTMVGGNISADLIIVDENIEDALIRTTKLYREPLDTLEQYSVPYQYTFIDWLNDVYSRENGEKIDLTFLREHIVPKFEDDVYDYIDTTPASLIPVGFFDCKKADGFISGRKRKAITIITKSPLIDNAIEKGIPVKLFTATPMSNRLKDYYGINVPTITAPLAKNIGTVYQYRGITGARGSENEKVPKLIEYVNKYFPPEVRKNYTVISFKGTADL